MLKKNRSAPNAGVIPVLYYSEVRKAVEWLTTALPSAVKNQNATARANKLGVSGERFTEKSRRELTKASGVTTDTRGKATAAT